MCVCVYSVCKQNDTPRTGCEIIRAHTPSYIQNAETECCVKGVFCLSSLFLSSLSLSTRQTNDQFTRVEVVVAAMAVKLDVWMCGAYDTIVDTIQRPRWRKPRFCVLSSSRIYYYYCCVHYNINAVVNCMHRWQTRVYYICIRNAIFIVRASLHTCIYNNMRTVQVGQCNIIYVYTWYTHYSHRRIVPIYNNNLWFYVYLLYYMFV